MSASDNIDELLDRMDWLCHSDYCQMMLVLWWNL